MDEWHFPVGTKVWKEFSRDGKRLETRLFWKTEPNGWLTRRVRLERGRDRRRPRPSGGVRTCAAPRTTCPSKAPATRATKAARLRARRERDPARARRLGHDARIARCGGLLSDAPDRDLALPNDPDVERARLPARQLRQLPQPARASPGTASISTCGCSTAEAGGAASATRSYQSTVGVAVTDTVGGTLSCASRRATRRRAG